MKRSVIALIVGLSTMPLMTCATNPATGERQLSLISEGREIEMGREAAQQVEASIGLVQDEDLQEYVSRLGQEMAAETERPDLPWSFKVVEDATVNAFALPGGFIYFTRGIMTHFNSEAEFAAVLGHEIGHVTARHSVERLSRAQLAQLGLGLGAIFSPEVAQYADLLGAGLGVLFLKFSRDDERQSDELGLRYMLRTNYQPQEMIDVFNMLGRVTEAAGGSGLPGWLSTHPAPEDRAERITSMIQEMRDTLPEGTVVNRDRYLRHLEGMVFGVNPRHGFFREQLFLHPDLEFQLQFPSGWQTQNMTQAVVAVSPQQDAAMQLTLSDAGSADEAARQFLSQQGVQSTGSSRDPINGLPAAWVGFGAETQQGPVRGVATFLEYDGRVYQILGYSSAQMFSQYSPVVQRSMQTFDRLTDQSALNVQPRRLELVTIREPMTLEQFVRRYPSTASVQTLAIINGFEPGETIPAGHTLKRVVGGELPGS